MDAAAAKLLVELVGASLGQLDGQIRSLVAFCKERQRITEEDVSKLVGGDRARQFWDLTNAITARYAPVALRALSRLMRDAESPGWLVGKIGQELRRLIKVKELSDQRLPLEEIARRAGMQPWLAKKLLRAVRGVSAEELKANLRLVLEADVDCKTGGGRDSWILERLVLKLCSRPGQRPPDGQLDGQCGLGPGAGVEEACPVAVADRHGEGVGGVLRLRRFAEPEDHAHHFLNLRLVRVSVAHDGFLDFRGGVLAQRTILLGDGDQRHSSPFPHSQRGGNALPVERLLDRNDVGVLLPQHAEDSLMDPPKPVGIILAPLGLNRPEGDGHDLEALGLHDAVSHDARARINPQDPHD